MSEFDEVPRLDPHLRSKEGRVPKFLKLTYLLLPIWGIFSLYFFWDGSISWLDRGRWHQLQIAANTTAPFKNHNRTLTEKIDDENQNNDRLKDEFP